MIYVPLPPLIVAVFFDLRQRRIPNYITYPLFLAGLAFSFWAGHWPGLRSALLGAAVAGFLPTILPGPRPGGGDIKLMAACGAWLGSGKAVDFLLYFLLAALVVQIAGIVVSQGFRGLGLRLRAEFLTMGQGVAPTRTPAAHLITLAYLLAV